MDKEVKKRVDKTFKSALAAVEKIGGLINESFFETAELLLERRGKIIVTGVGKSGFIGMKFVATLTSLGHQSVFLHPVEALHGDTGVVADGDVLVALSFSGESSEIVKIVKYIQKTFNVGVVAITNKESSSLGKLSDKVVLVEIDDEGSPYNLAPMSSTTATLVVCDMLASAITEPDRFEKHHFAKYHPGGSLGLSLQIVGDVMFKDQNIPMVLENEPLNKALEQMSSKERKGIVAVVDSSKKLTGVISDGDLRRFIMGGGDSKKAASKDLMTKSPKTIRETDSLKEALGLMENSKITSLFVVDSGGVVCGFIHMHQIIEGYIV